MKPDVQHKSSELICSQLIAIAIVTLSMSNNCHANDNLMNNNHNISSIIDNNDLNVVDDNNVVPNNNVIYNSNDNRISNVVKSIKKQPDNYIQQKIEGLSIIKDKKHNKEYEQYLFSFNDNNIVPNNKIDNIKGEINNIVKDIVLDKNNCDAIKYKQKTEEQRIDCLANAMIRYYSTHADYIFNQNIINDNVNNNIYKYEESYIPFSILQIMYDSIGKYGKDIADKVINVVYNNNKDTVNDAFKEIYQNNKFDYEITKKNHGFLGAYSFNNVPNKKELDELQGKELANYWEHANHNEKIFPSVNVHYTDEYLKEAYKRWDDNIQFKLNTIIEQNIKNKPIEHILNYYSIVANRAPNIYLSNNVIDFIYKKLDINDTIYFIDKFVKMKQNYLTEDDVPSANNNFQNILNEYPNGNLKDYNLNVFDKNCIALIFNSSDKYNGVVAGNNIITDQRKEDLYNRLNDNNMTFNLTKWNINRHSKVNHEGIREYNTLFLYYRK